jgi:glucose-6-phosphate 1-dehydrogenase
MASTDTDAANMNAVPAPPCTLVVFGAVGDLTKRLLMPAIYNLAGSRLLDDGMQIIGADHNVRTADTWREELSSALESFTHDASAEFHPDHIDAATWAWVAKRIDYIVFDFEHPGDYAKLGERLAQSTAGASAIFYLAVSARFFGTIVDGLGAAGLLEESDGAFRRIVVEKPFGSDLATASALNARILGVAAERQVYRIDHFLGKEPVQGIMALRFGNGIFEPMWRRERVDSVQITAAETIGVEHRGAFYEPTGALRDMVPNHLFSLLTMIAMDAPESLDPEAVRNEKAKLVEAIRPLRPADAVRGQYAAGTVDGTAVAGYRDEARVAPDSRTETYAALKVQIDNPRWNDVPFYLRTGKRLARHLTTIAIQFRAAPPQLFEATPDLAAATNLLTLGIAPKPGVSTDFRAKAPGPLMRLGPARSAFAYDAYFDEKPSVGYETLLYHCMTGNPSLFQRDDMIEASWAAVQPVLDDWSSSKDAPAAYVPGSDGPAPADELPARDGRRWLPLAESPREVSREGKTT